MNSNRKEEKTQVLEGDSFGQSNLCGSWEARIGLRGINIPCLDEEGQVLADQEGI